MEDTKNDGRHAQNAISAIVIRLESGAMDALRIFHVRVQMSIAVKISAKHIGNIALGLF